MPVRGFALIVAFAFVSAPNGAAAGERKIAGGFELLPLVAPRAPAARPAPAPALRPVCVRLCDGFFFPVPASAASNADTESVCPPCVPASLFLVAIGHTHTLCVCVCVCVYV